jgi:Activator of Hsp90 ATPase homolog 1-like protein
MKKLHFEIQINAPIAQVWDTMLADETYRKWTSAFNPGSFYEGDWEKGSTIKFMGPDGEGKLGGLSSMIAENRKHEFISIEHRGFISNGVEDFSPETVGEWAGAHENYTFTEKDGGTLLEVDIDVADAQIDEFADMWPRSLQLLKKLCEE